MKEIPLTQGKVALVDDEDYEWLNKYKWCVLNSKEPFYARRSLKSGTLYMHCFIINAPLGFECDHIDGNGLNNQRCNLRICTRSQNHMNQKLQNNRSSKFKGVSWHDDTKKWQSYITPKGRFITLGYFTSEIEAAQVYDTAALKYFGEYARLNFSDSDVANFQVTSL